VALGFAWALVAARASAEPPGEAGAEGQAQPPPPVAAAIVAPRTDPALETVRSGLREWLIERLAAAGLELSERSALDTALAELAAAGRPVQHGADVPALAARTGAARVLLCEVWFERGEADLRLHLHDASGAAIAGTQARARVAELPAAAQRALAELAGALQLDARAIEQAGPPRLADWSAFGRARALLAERDLAGAWRALASATGPTAEWLRAEIDARGAAPDATPAMRSRLANASGRSDSDWLRVREALRGPADPDTLLAAADAAVAQADPERALRLYERVVELDPRRVAARVGKAEALAEAGRGDEAVEALRAAVELAPREPALQAALARSPSLPADQRAAHWLRAGELQRDRFETEAARTSFEEAGRADGGILGLAQRNVAALDERIGNQGEALLSYEQAAELGTRDPDLLLGLGRTRAASQDREGAAAAFREALGQAPELAPAHAGLGEVLVENGRDEEALPHLEKAVALDPADVAARRTLARARARRGQAQAALEVLEGADLPASVSERGRAILLEDAARIRKESGDLAGAERTLGAAVALEPDDPPLRTALASIYEAQGQAERARAELTLATSLGAGRAVEIAGTESPDPASAGGERTGDASYASFEALVASFPTESPPSGRPLGRVLLLGAREERSALDHVRAWLLPKVPDLEAIDLALLAALVERFPIEETPEIPSEAAPQVSALLGFSTERETIATVNHLLGSDAVLVARLHDERRRGDRIWAAPRPVLEVRLLGGAVSSGVFILGNSLRLEGLPGLTRWNTRALGPWLALLAALAWPFVRGWGTVVVRVDYDTKASKGFFHVRLSRKPGKAQTARQKEGQSALRRYQQKVRWWSRFTRSMADVETRFRLVPARTWYVHVHGLLTNPANKEVIGNYVEERTVAVARGAVTPVVFDLRPREAPIEVRLTQGSGGEVKDSMVQAVAGVRGRPDSQRYLRGGSALLHVGNGTHRVVVGCGDRVYEQEVYVHDLAGASVCFNVESEQDAVFSGCLDAVEPYLNGDLTAASQALDRAGQTELANLLRAEYHKERGETAKAARYFEAAGRMQEAAELASEDRDAQHSATLFAQAGDFGRAGERYRETGDWARAAEAYEAAFDYDAAIDCHRRAGNLERAQELLEKTGRYFEAGQVALASDDPERAIRNLQMVDLRDPDHAEACKVLAQMFAERGDLELAAAKLGEAISSAGDLDGAPLELLEQLGDLLQRAGQVERALETFEAIRKRDYTWVGAAERVEALRGLRRSEQSASDLATRASGKSAAAAPAGGAGESRYEIVSELGRGGMGVVYEARDRRLGRSVALKRLPDNLRENPTAVQLFLREARAAAALNHVNIVTLFDADQEEGNYYLTMEFLDGLPLDKILKKRGRLTARDCVRLGVQIATGLQYAHERRIVHRDIKTSNLFFTRERVVKIMDFGLAKMVEEVRRAATVIGGTPYYMAPEQATGENVDHRADLYAFGVTLFELLTGSVPFREGDVTWHHRHTPPPDPRSLAQDLPDALVALVLQLMAKDPAARPASAGEVGARLAEIGRALGT
jgi:tetratricopeptide (TPR) repeat protein